MDDLLTPVSQVYTSNKDKQPFLQEVTSGSQPIREKSNAIGSSLSSYEDALEALKAEPDYDDLSSVLKFLLNGHATKTQGAPHNVHQPNALNSQIIQTLVTNIVPNYWQVLKDEAAKENQDAAQPQSKQSPLLQRLLGCLLNLTGLNAILTHLRGLIGELGTSTVDTQRSMMGLNISTLLDLLCSLLNGHTTLHRIWTNISQSLGSESMLRPLTQEFVNVIGGGRIVSLAAEAEKSAQKISGEINVWVASNKDYSIWLVRNIIAWARKDSLESPGNPVSQLLTKALQLGHTDLLVDCIVEELLLSSIEKDAELFEKIFDNLPRYDQKRILMGILKYATDVFSSLESPKDEKSLVYAVAGLLRAIVNVDEKRRGVIVGWLTSVSGGAAGEHVGIRRAAIAVLAEHREDITAVLEKSMALFGDNLYIKHAPLLQQEAHAQILLLSAGYVHRLNPNKLAILVKSGVYLNAVSNRLSAPQTRARVLGMIVGEALSTLTQGIGKALSFDMDILKTEEAKWYKSLVEVTDTAGSLEPLRQRVKAALPESKVRTQTQRLAKPVEPPKKTTPKHTPRASGFVIEEVSESEEDDDDLVPYAKPDSDREDSEDDAELVRRDKPRAPVYIRDLITYLRDTENYDKQELALTTAPVLIRRKANYGTEVKDHAEELAGLLVGIQDKFNMDGFESLRIQGMVSIIIAQPQKMGPWFAKTFFDGDYSLSQRASVLTVLGLAAREIAGFEQSEYADSASFPSKKLPEKVEQFYLGQTGQNRVAGGSNLKSLPPSAIDSIVQTITADFLAPLVANAADKQTGPDLLKLSSFASRLQQRQGPGNSASKSQKKAGVRVIANTTAQLVSTSFFFPLTARFQAALSSSTSRARAIVLQPELLAHLLRTLGILMHAAGPSTLSLPDMTAELWGLLLGSGVRARCAGDLGVTRAALFALLALLEVNGNEELRMREICRELAREVVETQEWVAQVFENTHGGDGEGGEENEVKMLAAGVLIRLRDAMERFRAFLIGDMIAEVKSLAQGFTNALSLLTYPALRPPENMGASGPMTEEGPIKKLNRRSAQWDNCDVMISNQRNITYAHSFTQSTVTMGQQASAPTKMPATTAPAQASNAADANKPKEQSREAEGIIWPNKFLFYNLPHQPCCVCKDEKAARDECMLFSNAKDPAEDCKTKIEQYKSCMAGFGFKV
ncbi:hypothetical protein PpBr36_07620 [Pyricularia pennisetigena]|uniref:hypothetical protein n=1 Tax=Pyricularia pennisetigena TaxID=1578925 RepID=UPI0011507A34|nr:hypothetical protein PpBr36_07620 [Pyricularia pennisetigena]TLS25016.1 hypothetical protein PpBr36_07620 [Pyricularia pennisetigena]